ncbi:MAG: rod shape-determining protein MreD [Elusimicrobia bacterium]|nr:rod shape-determining protein MreD [Elusimicrobiota bacterium]
MSHLRGAVLFLAAALLQWWWSTRLSLWGLSPQILLVLTVAMAARLGANSGMCYGFLWGLFLDVLRPELFGGNACALMLVGYGTGALRRQIDVLDVVSQYVIVFFMTWGYFLLYGLLGAVFAKQFLWAGWPAFLCDPLYNCLIVPLAGLACAWLRVR